MTTVLDFPPQKSATLEEREARIEEAERNSYYVRGCELKIIRDDSLWKARYNYPSFREYCEERWELTIRAVEYVMAAAEWAGKANNCSLPMPSRESHIRPLLERLKDDDDRIAVWRELVTTANGARIKAADVDDAISQFLAMRDKEHVTLTEWHELNEAARSAVLGRSGKKGLNKQDNADIEWADWSWNPVTGCLHGCPYCYARDIAASIYVPEVGFSPTLWPDRLTAPANQKVPDKDAIASKNIFTCSMADLFGRWVPSMWIDRVLRTVADNPQWNFLFLTKFPKRMSEFEIPPNAWLGTTVDLQARVANAEKAFEKVKAPIKWLSIEPMSENLKFNNLKIFDWIVIGGASKSKATDGSPETPDWNPPIEWIVSLHQQAREAGCKIYYKTNSGLSDMTRIREFPGADADSKLIPQVFDYLRNVPKDERIG